MSQQSSPSSIRFDGQVVVVTGAGRGLGRSHALAFAERGARVVVNDLGGNLHGGQSDEASPAEAVVAEIVAAGGDAIASGASVDTEEGAAAIIDTAIATYGRVDVVINNAGILRDTSFAKLTTADWDAVVSVHLRGSALVTRAAWPHLRAQRYGRIVNTTSAAGLYGNFGQTNYGAAKMGLVGLTLSLAQEGAKYGIGCNVIAPVARSRMTETILPPAVLERLKPELVTPLVAYLASASCEASGQVFAVGGGYVSRVAVFEGRGVRFDGEIRPEDIESQLGAISDLSEGREFSSAMAAISEALK